MCAFNEHKLQVLLMPINFEIYFYNILNSRKLILFYMILKNNKQLVARLYKSRYAIKYWKERKRNINEVFILCI